jgi:hypothetical protein
MAPVVDRGPDADEDDVRGDARGAIEDGQVARCESVREGILDTGLTERDVAVAELDESVGICLDELDRVTHPGQADGADKAHITGSDDGDGSVGSTAKT